MTSNYTNTVNQSHWYAVRTIFSGTDKLIFNCTLFTSNKTLHILLPLDVNLHNLYVRHRSDLETTEMSSLYWKIMIMMCLQEISRGDRTVAASQYSVVTLTELVYIINYTTSLSVNIHITYRHRHTCVMDVNNLHKLCFLLIQYSYLSFWSS